MSTSSDFMSYFGSQPTAFTPIPDRERIIASVDAKQNEGKTHFAGTIPDGPRRGKDGVMREGVLYQCFDKKSLTTIEKFRNGQLARKKIAVKDYSYQFPAGIQGTCGFGVACTPACQVCQLRAKIANEALVAMKEDFYMAVKTARGIVWDHGAAPWETIRFARYGRNASIPPKNYGDLNKEFEEMLDRVYESDCSLILLHRLGDEYEDVEKANARGEMKQSSEKTGRMVRKGAYSHLGFKVQAEVQLRFDRENKYGVGTITTCQRDMTLCNKEIPRFDFFALASTIAPSVDPGAWL